MTAQRVLVAAGALAHIPASLQKETRITHVICPDSLIAGSQVELPLCIAPATCHTLEHDCHQEAKSVKVKVVSIGDLEVGIVDGSMMHDRCLAYLAACLGVDMIVIGGGGDEISEHGGVIVVSPAFVTDETLRTLSVPKVPFMIIEWRDGDPTLLVRRCRYGLNDGKVTGKGRQKLSRQRSRHYMRSIEVDEHGLRGIDLARVATLGVATCDARGAVTLFCTGLSGTQIVSMNVDNPEACSIDKAVIELVDGVADRGPRLRIVLPDGSLLGQVDGSRSVAHLVHILAFSAKLEQQAKQGVAASHDGQCQHAQRSQVQCGTCLATGTKSTCADGATASVHTPWLLGFFFG